MVQYEAGVCPKCHGGDTGFLVEQAFVWFSCLCGYRVLRYEATKDGTLVSHVALSTLKLPRLGSRLRACLIVVSKHTSCSTEHIAQHLQDSVSKVATQLTVLRGRGFVVRTVNGRGIAGGSIWSAAEVSIKLLKVK